MRWPPGGLQAPRRPPGGPQAPRRSPGPQGAVESDRVRWVTDAPLDTPVIYARISVISVRISVIFVGISVISVRISGIWSGFARIC